MRLKNGSVSITKSDANQLRNAMTQHKIHELALYHEQRARQAPTAARLFDQFTDLNRHHPQAAPRASPRSSNQPPSGYQRALAALELAEHDKV